MFRDHHIMTTRKFPKLEHIFSSKKHKIYRAYQSQSALTYLTKILIVNDQKIFNHYKYHLTNNILPFLQRSKYLKTSSLLGINPASVEIMIMMTKGQPENNLENQYDYPDSQQQIQQKVVREDIETNTMFITKEFIQGVSLRQMIINKDQRLDSQFCIDLVGEIVDCLFMAGGVKDFFITTENIIVHDSGLIYFNYFSLVGLQFWKYDKYIPRSQFEQILPYLNQSFVKEIDPNKRVIDIQIELKFIMINFISAFLKRDFIFDHKHFELDFQVKRADQKIAEAINKITNHLLPILLSKQQLGNVKSFDYQYKVKYLQLLNRLNIKRAVEQKIKVGDQKEKVQQKQDIFDLNWQEILRRLSPTFKIQRTEDEIDFARRKYQFKNYLNIKNNENFHLFFSSVLLEIIDIYINIIELLSKQHLHLQNNQLSKRAETLHKQRQQLIKRKRYTKSLYIPIKSGMRFSQILKYSNWVHMLVNAKETNQWTLNSIFQLLRFIQTMKEDIYQNQTLISKQLLEKAIRNRKYVDQWRKNNQNNISQTVYALFLKQKTNQQFTQNIKQVFWQTFYQVINKMMLLMKKYYLRVTQHSISHNIKVNRNDFWQILIRIKLVIPDMPSKHLKRQKSKKNEIQERDIFLQNTENLNNHD